MRKQSLAVLVAAVALPVAGCDTGQSNVLGGVPAIAYLSREPVDTGNVFDYAGGGKNGNLFTLTPPTANGVKKNISNFDAGGDINSFDVSFDAREIVFSGKRAEDKNYHVFRVNVDGSNPCDAAHGKVSQGPCQITDGPNDEVYPIYLPGGRIFYVTNRNVEGDVPQFRDEYERATTAQVGTMSLDGSDQVLGPRNVSHRVAPTLLSDGRIMLTEWRHLGDVNEGDLVTMNQDLTGVREGFGREGTGLTNSYLRAREIAPGLIVTIGTSRDRTYQAGKILRVDLGGPDISKQSEKRSKAEDLTPLVPGDRTPSLASVGRYYDAFPIGKPSDGRFLVSWADGPVETGTLEMAKAQPDFGIYVYDANAKTRFPVVNEIGRWEVNALPLVERPTPPPLTSLFPAQGTQSTLISAINVYNSTMFPSLPPGTVKKVRITEGFSSEEGFPNDFGLTEFDGQARLGEIDLGPDGSFKALVPANTPVRIQLVDQFGLAADTKGGPGGDVATEPVWIQGRPGEARVCGGCHEDRTSVIQLAPGSSALQALNAAKLDFAGKTRQERVSTTFTRDGVMGVPWDKALQPIFDKHCIKCHDGTPSDANPTYQLTDVTDMTMFKFTFDLTSKPVTIMAGDRTYTYSASHVSLLGPSMALREKQVMVTMGKIEIYIEPGSARQSKLIQMLNPPRQYPPADAGFPMAQRAFSTVPHLADVSPGDELTLDEYFLLSLAADNGGQYYSRENRPEGAY